MSRADRPRASSTSASFCHPAAVMIPDAAAVGQRHPAGEGMFSVTRLNERSKCMRNRSGGPLRRGWRSVATFCVVIGMPLAMWGVEAPSAGAAVSHGRFGGTLAVDLYATTWPSLLPWQTTQNLSGLPIFDAFASSLFVDGPNATYQPGLAAKYKFSNGDRVLNVTLRPNLKFQDGTPLNAAAVVYNWNQNLAYAKARNVTTGIGGLATGFSVINNLTAQIQFSSPYPPAVGALADNAFGWMISPTEIATKGLSYSASLPISAGPYQVTGDTGNAIGATITLTKSASFWNAKHQGFAHTITFTQVGDESSALLSLQSGQAQAVIANGGLDPNIIVQAKSDGLKMIFPPATWTDFIAFGMKASSATANPIVRQAIEYATNRVAINKALFGGQYQVIDQMIAKGSFGYTQTIPGMPTYNPSKAAHLISSLPGPVNVTIQPILNTPTWVQLSDALQAEWQAVGMHVTVNAVAQTQALAILTSGNLDAFLSQVGNVQDPALGSMETFYHDAALGNNDASVLGLINKTHQVVNPAARTKAYVNLSEAVVVKNAYVFPLFGKSYAYAVTKNVQGLTGTRSANILLANAYLS